MRRLRRARVLVLIVAFFAAAARPAPQPLVPSPRDVLGFTPGDDYKLADFNQIRGYFESLDAASDRVILMSAGKSTEGRDILVAVISSEANLARLERYRDISRRLALVRGLPDNEARSLAREGKAVVWIDNGLHASEVATVQHSLLLAWRVATEESPEMQAIRDSVILVLLPTINPDGLDLVADWYRRTLGTPYQDSPMPWLYQKYVGHDNNRDFYMQTQEETRVVSRLLYSEWLPQIMYNQHQGTWPPRMFVPPFPDPFNPNIDPQIMRGIDLVGGAMLYRFEREQKDGIVSRYEFSTWYNGSVRTASYFHNIIGILTETGHASATPFTYSSADFPRQLSNGISTLEPSTSYPNPWKGGTLHLRDAVDYMLTGSLAVLDVAARYREQLLYGIYQVGVRQIEKGRREAPVAYLVPPTQHDLPAAAKFLETLMRGAIDVDRAEASFTADGREYPAGTWVVRLDQPFRAFARDLFEAQRYPDLRSSPGGKPIPPYDTAGWTLAFQMGVEAVAIARPFDAHLVRLDAFPAVKGAILDERGRAVAARPGTTYAVAPSTNNSAAVINRLLAAKVPVRRVRASGAFLVTPRTRDDARALADAARTLGVDARRLRKRPGAGMHDVRRARIGLYRSWVANIDEGWIRWLLEQYGFAYTTLRNQDILAGNLGERFDVVLVPAQSASAILDGHAATAPSRTGPTGPVPPEYRGGIGADGVAALKAFVQDGGHLVTFEGASDLVLDKFGGLFTRIRNPIAHLDQAVFYCPGSVLRIDVDPEQPGTFGMPASTAAYFAQSRAFETDDPSAVTLVRYAQADKLLMSGWLLGADRLGGRQAALEVPFGKGQVTLFGFRPHFRAQSHATFKLLFNQLFVVSSSSNNELGTTSDER
jgi:hypothetical protein